MEPIERQRNMCELQKPVPKQGLPVPKPKLCVIDQVSVESVIITIKTSLEAKNDDVAFESTGAA